MKIPRNTLEVEVALLFRSASERQQHTVDFADMTENLCMFA